MRAGKMKSRRCPFQWALPALFVIRKSIEALILRTPCPVFRRGTVVLLFKGPVEGADAAEAGLIGNVCDCFIRNQ